MVACIYVIILILQAVAVNSQSPAILSVANVIPGATATFECSLPSLTSPTPLDIDKDNVDIYTCTNIAFTCSKAGLDSDYSDVTFTDLGTASAKGTFTVANADQTRDGGEWTCKYGTSLRSSSVNFVVSAQSPATLSVTNVIQGATATFECSYPNLRSPTSLDISKDGVALYTCTDIALICSKSSTDNDYSDVTFTDLSTASAKGTFTVANVDQSRDGGVWTCKYGTSLISSSVTFVVIAQSPATFSVTNVLQGATATFECSYPILTSPTTLDIYKDSVALYQCTDIALTCSKSSPTSDYSDVTFTALGLALAKGTFTVTNADRTRDGGDWTCQYGTSSLSSPDTFVVTAPATFSVTNVLQGATATFECSYPSLASPTTLDINKDGVALYQCTDIASTCSKSNTDNDYSDVTFTDLDKALAKGTFTVANADQTRDGGEWKCKYGSSLISSSVTFVVTGASTTQTATSTTISLTLSSTVSSSASPSTVTVPSTQESETTTTNRTTTNANNANPTTTIARNTNPTTTSARNTHPTTTNARNTTPTTTNARNTNPTTSNAMNTNSTTPSTRNTNPTTPNTRNTNPTTTSTRNTNPTTTSARSTTDETIEEWELVYFFFIVPTMITLTVVILVITFVCNRTRTIKRSRPPSGMETYSVCRRGKHMNTAFEPPARYSMPMKHSSPFYVSREYMLNENTSSSGTNTTHDQIFFENTCTTKVLLEGIEGLHASARYMRNWSDLNDSSVNLFM